MATQGHQVYCKWHSLLATALKEQAGNSGVINREMLDK
jgi:hypothetical protein